MADTRARQARSARRAAGARSSGGRTGTGRGAGRTGTWAWIIGGAVVAVIALAVGIALSSSPSTSAGGTPGTVVQGNGGTWTNITPDTLATKLGAKDFALVNVKTPYIGEIAGTDLYIPYTDLAARSAELPADKAAPIVVYCRSGAESAIASQTLLDLGYTNIENLDGGMSAWVASGRELVQVPRS